MHPDSSIKHQQFELNHSIYVDFTHLNFWGRFDRCIRFQRDEWRSWSHWRHFVLEPRPDQSRWRTRSRQEPCQKLKQWLNKWKKYSTVSYKVMVDLKHVCIKLIHVCFLWLLVLSVSVQLWKWAGVRGSVNPQGWHGVANFYILS